MPADVGHPKNSGGSGRSNDICDKHLPRQKRERVRVLTPKQRLTGLNIDVWTMVLNLPCIYKTDH